MRYPKYFFHRPSPSGVFFPTPLLFNQPIVENCRVYTPAATIIQEPFMNGESFMVNIDTSQVTCNLIYLRAGFHIFLFFIGLGFFSLLIIGCHPAYSLK
jgi:hypothetical protein